MVEAEYNDPYGIGKTITFDEYELPFVPNNWQQIHSLRSQNLHRIKQRKRFFCRAENAVVEFRQLHRENVKWGCRTKPLLDCLRMFSISKNNTESIEYFEQKSL